jgi:hypothetical protein
MTADFVYEYLAALAGDPNASGGELKVYANCGL